MFSKIGVTELLVILAIVLLIFGPTKLPQLGKAIGQTLSGFKKGQKEGTESPANAEEVKPSEESTPL
ncbi:MAG: twin-arginine translocase TatA/TatE family subunit [Christensenellales bacterium]|jgi:sec-independent protein translocase protein TatA